MGDYKNEDEFFCKCNDLRSNHLRANRNLMNAWQCPETPHGIGVQARPKNAIQCDETSNSLSLR